MNWTSFSILTILLFYTKTILAATKYKDFKITFNDTGVSESDVHFYLYTRNSLENPVELFIGNETVITQSAYNVSNPTKFMTHGWLNSYHGFNCKNVTKAFLAHDDYNVIVVDWNAISKLSYLEAVTKIKAVGGIVARMISFLESQGSSTDNMSLVGHSLGAQMMGLAGYQTANKVAHIVGLDPAGPGFYTVGPGQGISKEDGKLVEIIHTNAHCMDVTRPVGHADYYPNSGGPKQPGCGVDEDCNCAHDRAYLYYAEAIMKPDMWLARRCDDYGQFLSGKCANNEVVPFPSCSNNRTAKKGTYFLHTRDSSPFGLGEKGTIPPQAPHTN